MKTVIFLINIVLLPKISFAQQSSVSGPFDYSPPDSLAHFLWNDSDTSSKLQLSIPMNTMPALSVAQDDGILIKFNLTLNSDPASDHNEIIQFYDFTVLDSAIISFIYSNKSIIVNRRWNDAPTMFYMYTIYDQLFENSVGTYEMKIYLTADFIFIASKDLNSLENKSYLSPLLFGINLPINVNSMYNFLHQNIGASICVGSQYADNKHRISNTSLYSFSYVNLRKNILDNFVHQ